MNISLQRDVPLLWHYIHEIRQVVDEALRDYPYDFRSATAMTASELVENAIKYGESVPSLPSARFTLRNSDGFVEIEVANGTTNLASVVEIQKHVEEIARSIDEGELYLRRMQIMMSNPSETGKLGLYRIGFEGQFNLACSYESQVVTVIATRKVFTK